MSAGRLVEGSVPSVATVPWRLRLPRGRGKAPLLVALHGKGDRLERFEREALDALPRGWALLLPAGPIPRDRWDGRHGAVGRSWYLYDGDTPAFRESLRRAEAMVVGLLARLSSEDPPKGYRGIDPARIAVLGFSQGAYLAGTLAVRHPEWFSAAVLVAGRLKHEILGEHFPAARRVRLLGLHGRDDRSVPPEPSRRSMAAAKRAGLKTSFRTFDAKHGFTAEMRAAARRWLGG